MASMLNKAWDGMFGKKPFRFDQNPAPKKQSVRQTFNNSYKPKAAPKKKTTPFRFDQTPKATPRQTLKNSYSPPKRAVAPKKKASSGGAVGQGGRVYKNGYVDSKGNRVVNGKWVSPKKVAAPAPKRANSGSGSNQRIASQRGNNDIAKARPAVRDIPKKVAPKKTAAQLKAEKANKEKKYLAGDTQYQNELGGLSDALARYVEQNSADTNSLNRSYKGQAGKNGSIEKNRKKSQVGNSEGFASRGMLKSGGYTEQATDINNTYKEQTARVTDAYNDDKGRLTRAKSAETETVNQKREQARVAALSRKANQEILKAQASSQ